MTTDIRYFALVAAIVLTGCGADLTSPTAPRAASHDDGFISATPIIRRKPMIALDQPPGVNPPALPHRAFCFLAFTPCDTTIIGDAPRSDR